MWNCITLLNEILFLALLLLNNYFIVKFQTFIQSSIKVIKQVAILLLVNLMYSAVNFKENGEIEIIIDGQIKKVLKSGEGFGEMALI